MRALLILLLDVYRGGISPLLGPRCRFYPTCSCYAQEAIRQHGSVAGLYLAARRLLRCHPWHPGGYDPVPVEPPLLRPTLPGRNMTARKRPLHG